MLASFLLDHFSLNRLANRIAGCAALLAPVVVEHNIIVVLRHIGFQTKVLAQEGDQLGTRSIVCKLARVDSLMLQHRVKQSFTEATTLHSLVDIKVQDTKWPHFNETAIAISDEQLLVADLEETNALVAFRFNVASVAI